MAFNEPQAEVAIVGDPMAAVLAAAPFRRAGIRTITYLSGTEKRQRLKAMRDAHLTLTVEQANEHSPRLASASARRNALRQYDPGDAQEMDEFFNDIFGHCADVN